MVNYLLDTDRTYTRAQETVFWEQIGEMGHKYIFFVANLLTDL